MHVRLCSGNVPQAEVDSSGQAHGAFQRTLEVMLEAYRGLNLSVVAPSTISFGQMIDPVTKAYDGCIGTLQANLSEFMIGFVGYPNEAVNITHSLIDGFETMLFGTAYKKVNLSESSSMTQVMDMFTSFPADLWIIAISFYIFLFILLSAASGLKQESDKKTERGNDCEDKMTGNRSGSGHDVIEAWTDSGLTLFHGKGNLLMAVCACIMKQHSACGSLIVNYLSVSTIYTMLTILSFYGGFYLTSMIKTDMVVVDPPKIVKDYTDLIASGMIPLFTKIQNADYEAFERAPPGSKESQVWDIVVRHGDEESIADLKSPATILKIAAEVIEGKRAYIARLETFAAPLRKMGCKFIQMQNLNSIGFYTTHDPDAIVTQKEQIENHLITGSVISNQVKRRKQRSFESGIFEQTGRTLDLSSVMGMANGVESFSKLEECSNNVIEIPHPEMTAVFLFHYLSLVLIVLPLVVIAAVILCKEMRRAKLRRRNRVSPDLKMMEIPINDSVGIIVAISEAGNEISEQITGIGDDPTQSHGRMLSI
jgi:hypothetical protein